jgi:RNA polymerase sigma-70 factor (ECF subfamily)
MSDITDTELLAQFKNGDTASLGLIVDKYKGPLFSYIISVVKDSAAAEDIFQEVFLKIVKNPDCYKEQGNFKSWLFTVGRNKCMDYFRSSSSERNISLDDENDEELSLHETLRSGEKEPLEIIINSENGELIGQALDKLPREQREVIVLRQTMSFKEIAELLRCPIGTVLARASRGYKKMQEELIKNGAAQENSYGG